MTARHWSFGTTADVGLGAAASSSEGLFEELGKGVFGLMTDLKGIRPSEHHDLTVEGASPESLLVAFLSELIYLHDTEGWVFRRFEVRLEGRPPRRAVARAWGEHWDDGRHSRKVAVKAVTLHRLELDLVKGRARVILDI